MTIFEYLEKQQEERKINFRLKTLQRLVDWS